MEEDIFEINENTRKRYFEGWKNKFIRQYFYLNEGLNLMNQFKYLVAGILALYYFLEKDNVWLMVLMFIGSIPVLTLIGSIWVHRARKSMDWFGIEYTTHFGKYQITLQEKQNKLLNELKEILGKLNNNK